MRDRMKPADARGASTTQDLEQVFAEVGRRIGKAFEGIGLVMAAQGAMGNLVQGEPEKARTALKVLDADQRAKVAEAARQLAEMAEEGRV